MPPRRAQPGQSALPPIADTLVVGIGASAGGLEACTKLADALPDNQGMAFILVQHLDPGHKSMLVELLGSHTAMIVREAEEGMPIAPGHLYVIPPDTYLSVANGLLHLQPPQARHGARLPFDFLLQSLAVAYGPRSACIVLSGTGADGSKGLLAVRDHGGLVLAQDPAEAAYAGMPQSAIATGRVDRVLAVRDMPDALARHAQARPASGTAGKARRADEPAALSSILDLLRSETVHDFSLYKRGTLQRRVERRMALAAIGPNDMARYLQRLQSDGSEVQLLAKDLLIHVTSFFRDAKVFAHLAETVIPDLVQRHPPGQSLRVWVAGCSTGEETYSLAMLFQEEIGKADRPLKLQMFASDVDPQAVATARDGLYPEIVAAQIAPDRLARFFSQEAGGWRVAPDLRSAVVFTVQDLLADPPFSRLDMVSCRNLLIYLRQDAQEKVVSLFHFALREGGLLLLGTAETAAAAAGQFEVVAKAERLYRRVGRVRPQGIAPSSPAGDGLRLRPAAVAGRPPSRQLALAELGRRLVLDAYAPASVLINRANECLFSLGPTDRYLRLATGQPSHDLLAMARPGLRAKLRSAIDLARQDKARLSVTCRMVQDRVSVSVSIEVQPVLEAGEDLLLVCFVEMAKPEAGPDRAPALQTAPRVAELERELDATRTELQGAIRDLELSSEDQKAINEEALSVNEEYQSTNEELLASKEELQSLNEELTALNSQLQETLERQRTTADDLQNVLYSTNVATLFLDLDFRIRFFTPATGSLFAVLPGDVGRPLTDLASFVPDHAFEADAATVLKSLAAMECEIQTKGGTWFRRRILPYRAHGDRVEGIVITYIDITARKEVSKALEEAKAVAEHANAAKSRFLAAASHDLRQPLQTLALLQGLLVKMVVDSKAQTLLARFDDTLGAMTAMLNALLDINQIEAGIVRADIAPFPIGGLLHRMRDEFAYHAQAKGLALHVVSCSLEVVSDPHLLEQVVRNLLSNALKYTVNGKILLGCRRQGEMLGIEVWDTGIGIPESELDTIFEEYHQIGNAARERSRGLGLGLPIVQRLGVLLGHPIRVRSWMGRGSVFAVDVPRLGQDAVEQPAALPAPPEAAPMSDGTIMVVEDDPDVRELLSLILQGEGYAVLAACDGVEALAMLPGDAAPNLLLADYNLPNGLSGLQLIGKVRQAIGASLPAIVLTGDTSTATLRDATQENCVLLSKPVKQAELLQAVARLLAVTPDRVAPAMAPASLVFVVDDDRNVRDTIRIVLEDDGRTVQDHATSEAFLAAYRPTPGSCLLIDAYLPGMHGLDLLRHLRASGDDLPAIMITGQSDVPMAVRAMQAGASDFIEKPVGREELLASIDRALEPSHDRSKLIVWRENAATQLASLTPRQRQIMVMVVAGHPSKNIAADLDISQRTVENHRASIMRKTGSASLPALARLALAAAWDDAEVV